MQPSAARGKTAECVAEQSRGAAHSRHRFRFYAIVRPTGEPTRAIAAMRQLGIILPSLHRRS
jgi:hypothetical protein